MTRTVRVRGNRESVGVDCSGESKTQQHFAEQQDINNIVKRFTGYKPEPIPDEMFGDGSVNAADLQMAIDKVENAWSMYKALPAEVRTASNNNPVVFNQLISDGDPDGILRSTGFDFGGVLPPLEDVAQEPAAQPAPPSPPSLPSDNAVGDPQG